MHGSLPDSEATMPADDALREQRACAEVTGETDETFDNDQCD